MFSYFLAVIEVVRMQCDVCKKPFSEKRLVSVEYPVPACKACRSTTTEVHCCSPTCAINELRKHELRRQN